MMKFRTVKYLAKEGCASILKHKMMSLATLTTVVASFLVFGIFICLLLNLNHMVEGANEEPQISVICELELSNEEVKAVEDALKQMPEIASIKTISSEESFEDIKSTYFSDEDTKDMDVLEGVDKSKLFAVKISVNLKDATQNQEVIKKVKKIQGVNKVKMPQKIVEFVIKASNYIKVASISLLIFILIIAVLIISNAIKLTLMARKTQIGIMKYVGATNAFVRLPFVIEGIVIGVLGALISYGIVLYAYSSLISQFESISAYGISIYGLNDMVLPGMNFTVVLLVVFVLCGALIGAIGSAYSIKKYLKY